MYGIAELEEFEPVFVDMARTFEAQGIPADTSISEYGAGQYEINLRHVPNGRLAADHCVLMKRAVKGVARKHGLDATFMAKPFAKDSGNGLHVHFSVLDKGGRNLFAVEDGEETRRLHHAMGGLLATMNDAMAVFSVNANSFRRVTARPCRPFIRLRSCSGPWIPAFAGMTVGAFGHTPCGLSFPLSRE